MTEALWPKYLGLLMWGLGVYATRLLPAAVENSATVVVLIGFAAWFDWNTHRTGRELRRHLEALQLQKRSRAEAEVSPQFSSMQES